MNQRLQEAARLYAAQDYAAARQACLAILQADPRDFEALHLIGVLLTLLGQPAEALAYLRRAEAERAGHALLQVNLGNVLLALERYDEVLALSGDGGAAALNNLGLAHRGLGQHEAAARAFRAATRVEGNHPAAWFNLAKSLRVLGRPDEALSAMQHAQRFAPAGTPPERLADIASETAQALMALGRPEEALAECQALLRRHPDQTSVRWNMSLCLLALGRWQEGWLAYECRFGVPGHDARPDGAVVLDPATVAGKRVLILTEQGRGDMLQFVRYAPLLAARGAEVKVQAYPDLVSLLAAMPGVSAVVSTDDPRPDADLVTPVMSLPLAFGTQPADVPYLRAPADRQFSLGPSQRLRIGLVWSGSSHSYSRAGMPVAALAPLLESADFEFHCLQRDILGPDSLWLKAARRPIRLHTEALGDFADTAGLIQQMDAVVSIDTAVAHLAGALGKPVFVLLSCNPDWRWLTQRNDSPWYPTARLFRQPRPGDWQTVIRLVAAALPGVCAADGR